MNQISISIIACLFSTSLVLAKTNSHETDVQKSQASHSTHVDSGVNGESALKFLKNGSVRFKKQRFRNDGATPADVIRLSSAQHPHSIVLSCSDSRVPPEVLFDQKLGEIFVVRTAGESIDSSAIGSIEYAVEHLGVNNILVLGHTQCGAVKAALETLDGHSTGSPHIDKLVADLHPRLRSFAKKTSSEYFSDESWANAKGVAQDLISRSKIVSHAVQSGKVKISSALYNLHSGVVDFEGPSNKEH